MIDAKKTLGEIAVSVPKSIHVFERHGIDYSCGGERTLIGICGERDISVERIVLEIEAASASSVRSMPRYEGLTDLVNVIVSKHHTFTRSELGRLLPLAEEVERAHTAGHPEVALVRKLVHELASDLMPHLEKEELILFPYFVALEGAHGARGPLPRAPAGELVRPVPTMHDEHETVVRVLLELRSATIGYTVPEGVGEAFRELYAGLQALERDLHEHIHLENNVVFPIAERMAAELAARTPS